MPTTTTTTGQDFDEVKSLRNFISTLSHEVRTNISQIPLMCELLLQSNKLPPAGLEAIRKNARFAIEMLEKTMETFKQLDTTVSFQVQKKRVRLQECIRPVLDILISSIPERMITIASYDLVTDGNKSKELPSPLLLECELNTDKILVSQLISNLLQNAAKHSDSKTAIEIEINRNYWDLYIKVSNWGTFLSEDQLKVIFDPYKRLTPNKSGFGLGLYICRGIAEVLDAKITATSQPDDGKTTFVLHIPDCFIENRHRETMPPDYLLQEKKNLYQ